MPVTPTYPGLYLEELPSQAHSITAAPTSITAFVGYSHPYKTRSHQTAVQIFSFSEYEREFGGLYASGLFDTNLGHAVYQFFLNGGSVAYVVGLAPLYRDSTGAVLGAQPLPQVTIDVGGKGITFKGREPTDQIPMRITIDNTSGATGDITITYGRVIETYRGVSLNAGAPDPDPHFIDRVLGTATKPRSQLVTVVPHGTDYPGAMPSATGITVDLNPPSGFATTYSAADFSGVFQADTSLDKVEVVNLLCVPGISDTTVLSAALAFAESKLAFAIVDPPRQAVADASPPPQAIDTLLPLVPKSPNGALYFPYLQSTDPLTGQPIELPPSGYVAGKFSDTDLKRGVWKAPAGLETQITSTIGVVPSGRMTNQRQGVLNQKGVNCLRTFQNSGTVVFGARTLVSPNVAFEQWRYVPVRRTALFIEQTLMNNLGWAVFEPNDRPLWVALRTTVNDFMLGLFTQHAFQGSTPSQAFAVVCDETTTTQADIDAGIVNIIVGFRPLKPAEFVIIKISQLAGQPQA
jgi:phage tail sheath protein FI